MNAAAKLYAANRHLTWLIGGLLIAPSTLPPLTGLNIADQITAALPATPSTVERFGPLMWTESDLTGAFSL